MRRLAIFVVRRRWWIIGIALIALPAAAAYGANVHDALASGGFFDPGAESTLTRAAIVKEFPRSAQSDFAIVVTAKNGKVDDAAVEAAGMALTARLRGEPG
ncbi:MAG TPA: MMPL family transporter, partial [Acidimicrobiia bacterium]|nr:MMPL family transporter [Acidimicrobiia bacterium]